MPRRADKVTVETDAGVFDKFESLVVVNDVLGLTEATFKLGDDGAWPELEDAVAPGNSARIALNGKPRMVGRAEVNAVPVSAMDGTVVNLTVRTILADARYASADPSVSVQNTSIRDFVVAVYEPLGITDADFESAPFAARDLMTGKAAGSGPIVDLAPLTVEQAKINPPETIFEAVERHLRRYKATHWDDPSGKILIGTPDVNQAPSYKFQAKRDASSVANNVLSIERVKDWSEIAKVVEILGNSPGKDVLKAAIRSTATDSDVDEVATRTGQFDRRVLIPRQQVKDKQQADAQAERELSLRRRRKNAVNVTVDGWTYWTGSEQVPYAHNTTCEVNVDALGGIQGRYLVTKVALNLSVDQGTTTTLTCVAVDDFVL